MFDEKKITKVRFGPAMPISAGKYQRWMPTIYATYEGSDTEEWLFNYYMDDVGFEPVELVGLTWTQAMALKQQKETDAIKR